MKNLKAHISAALSVALSVVMAPSAFAEYQGSSFREIRNLLLSPAPEVSLPGELEERAVYQRGELPRYEITAEGLLQAAIRTTTEKEDFYPRLEKLLHSNGICFTGSWEITERSPYTGYFETGRRALFVGRASAASSETRRGEKRGFGFAGKLFPTEDPSQVVKTGNFFAVDVLMGRETEHFVDTAMTNEPEIGFNWSLLGLMLKIKSALSKADENPGFRPLTPISRLGLDAREADRTPRWMRIRAAKGTRRADEIDFRDELDFARHHPDGIELEVHVSETTQDPRSKDWRRIGRIRLRESIVSYGCDRQLHFAHPRLN